MRDAWQGALATTLALLGASACTLVVDQKQKQCERQADCAALLGENAPFVCENNYCVSPTCAADSDCARGGFATAVCGVDGRCQAGCVSDEECGAGNLCVRSTHRCRARECSDDTTCQNLRQSSTAICQEGACADPTWGCIGQLDNRPPPSMPTATLIVAFYNAISQRPVPATAVACPDPVLSLTTDCTDPLDGVTAVQDEETGIFTVTGLPQGAYFRLMITPKPNDEGLRVVDYYSQMTMRDVTEAPAPVTTVADVYLRNAGPSYRPQITIDGAMGGLFSQAFDCQNKPARGFSLNIMPMYQSNKITPPPAGRLEDYSPTVITYFANGQPSPLVGSETDPSGLVSVVNLPAESNIPLESYANGRKLPTINVRAAAAHITTVHFFPREYARVSVTR